MSMGHATLAFSLAFMMAGAAAGAAEPRQICIQTNQIDHTEIKDDSTILFYMNNHDLYKNALPSRCPGLRSTSDGFTYEPTDPATLELCGGLGTFRVNTGGRGPGAVCMFGPFVKLSPPSGTP